LKTVNLFNLKLKQMPGKKAFTIRHVLYATPAQVFQALTKPEKIRKWSGEAAVMELEPGGKFEMFGGWVRGNIIKVKTGSFLSFSWKPAEWGSKTKPSIVEMSFTVHAAGTEVTILHKDLPDEKEASSHQTGWIDHVLDPLNDYLIA
jgi:uncharacterized protein YndB with AHSA1/START domain